MCVNFYVKIGGAMKKSKIIFAVTFTVNLLECALSPFILVATIYGAGNAALMYTLIALEFAVWCGTAIVANVIAGRSVKTHWYAAVMPFILSVPVCFLLISPKYEKLWLTLSVDILLNALVCVAPLLISASRQRKKAAVQAEKTEKASKENNETI